MNYLRSFALLAGLGVLSACSSAPDETVGGSQADVTVGPRLTMAGEWKLAELPSGQSVEDYAVSRLIPDLHEAPIFVVSRRMLFAPDTYKNDLIVSRSDDGGKTFATISLIPDAPHGARIFVAPSDDRVVYVTAGGISTGMSMADAPGIVWTSTDGGVHFKKSSAVDAPVDLDINPTNPNHLVGATCTGLFRSMDGGATFARIDNSPDLHGMCNGATLYRGKNDRDTMYVLYSVGEGGSSILYRTTNGAGTWTSTATGQSMGGFEVHPNDAKHVYIFDAMRGWLSSADGGEQWNPHNGSLAGALPDGFWNVEISNVAFDTFTGAEPTLYIVNGGQVKRWVPMNAPEGGKFVTALAAPPQQLSTLRFENLYSSLKDGSPSPALMGITAWKQNEPRRLAIAHLDVQQ